MVSDRDLIFLSHFWEEFFTLQGSSFCRSSAYHPQSDGQTEVVNRSLENYLRCFTGNQPSTWTKWLPWAERWYNTTYQSAIKMTHFEAVYGRVPPRLDTYMPGTTSVHSVDLALRERDVILKILKDNLQAAQSRMKQFADKHRSEREFNVGDWVFLWLQPYRQSTLEPLGTHKLSPRFYGPYQILSRIGPVAYKLDLPPESKIHPVFHVSCLKHKLGALVQPQQQLPITPKSAL
ncbi:hypothetical protein ACOSP7_026816 [Xanthoceras sorbifolium]